MTLFSFLSGGGMLTTFRLRDLQRTKPKANHADADLLQEQLLHFAVRDLYWLAETFPRAASC